MAKRTNIKVGTVYYQDQIDDIKIIAEVTGASSAALFKQGADMVIALPNNQKIIKEHKKS